MSRRLINRSRASAAPSSTATETITELPTYQPPVCPLNESARTALGELSKDARATLTYHSQLREALRALGASVGDLQDRLRDDQLNLEAYQVYRDTHGLEKCDEETELEEYIPGFAEKVQSFTDKSEETLRAVIDRMIELEDESEILADLYTQSQTATVAKREGQDDDDMPPPPPSTLALLAEQRAARAAAHDALSPFERYARNNDYIAFKKLWHDAIAGEDGTPLPDASKWFDAEGRPVMRAEEGGLDGDDDIAVAREVISLNCPLTLRQMEEPYSNRKCKHTFEKAALLEYLPMREERQCPQTGCSEMFTRAKFEEDFFLDQAMLRRIRRARQALQHQEFIAYGNVDSDPDEDVTVRGQKTRPGGKIAKVEKTEQ